MPKPYLNITIGGQSVDVGSIEDFPIAISYKLEDSEDFQKKKGDEALNVKFPATLQNRKVANAFHDPASEDMSAGEAYKSNQPAVIEADGNELLSGKAFLLNASHTVTPKEYEYSFYGGNGDWIVDLKEATLYDFVSRINFLYGIINVINSWNYDGRDEALPYVFAPVRYRGVMDTGNQKDDNVTMEYLRPSISKYWILYWGFKSLGYRIQSNFFDTDYFRRQVMPWTWGNFHDSDGTKLDIHRFLAKSLQERYVDGNYNDWLEVYATATGLAEVYDNNSEFSYTNRTLQWQYKAPDNGLLDAHFAMTVFVWGNLKGGNSFLEYKAHWFYYDSATGIETEFDVQNLISATGRGSTLITVLTGGLGGLINRNQEVSGFIKVINNHIVKPGDRVSVKLKLLQHEAKGIDTQANFHTSVSEFKLDYFRIPINGTINFANYTGFKKYKFLDFLAGVVDEFNLSIQTDSTNRVVYMEPTHGYDINGTPQPGYFVNDFINWEGKQDLSKEAIMNLFSDYEKEVVFKYKDDANDGVLKVVQDRNQNTLAAGKYVFPDRFKAGKREHENRFFSPTVHYDVEQFKTITGIAPQMVTIIPENISNTSNSEADNTFTPKSCYYKGWIEGYGGWRFQGQEFTAYPFMFAVNYKSGGETDPVLSYSDENIGGIIAKGLMKKFFSQRLAIMRNGQFYEADLMLNDTDVNRLHREYKVFEGQRWELVEINNYLPLKSESTSCLLRKWSPITQADFNNFFPSAQSLNGGTLVGYDVKYSALKCLLTDIPK